MFCTYQHKARWPLLDACCCAHSNGGLIVVGGELHAAIFDLKVPLGTLQLQNLIKTMHDAQSDMQRHASHSGVVVEASRQEVTRIVLL
jgi:hypothetical protein